MRLAIVTVASRCACALLSSLHELLIDDRRLLSPEALQQQLQTAKFEFLTQKQQLADQVVENGELSERLGEESDKCEQLRNELLMLQAKRYSVEKRDVENVSDARLHDIEM